MVELDPKALKAALDAADGHIDGRRMKAIHVPTLIEKAVSAYLSQSRPAGAEESWEDFCARIYRENGGVTKNLQEAYDFYKANTARPAGELVRRLDTWIADFSGHRYGEMELSETDVADLAKDLRESSNALRARDGWRPIESAPKDGTEFQAWTGCWDPRCRYDEHGAFQIWGRVGYDEDGWDVYPQLIPTHWMPLPAAPSSGEP